MYDFESVDFLSGQVRFCQSCPDEDMLQVSYPHHFILDLGWYADIYKIYIIKDYEWGIPVAVFQTKNPDNLTDMLKEAACFAENESKTAKPYYGGPWQTKIFER